MPSSCDAGHEVGAEAWMQERERSLEGKVARQRRGHKRKAEKILEQLRPRTEEPLPAEPEEKSEGYE